MSRLIRLTTTGTPPPTTSPNRSGGPSRARRPPASRYAREAAIERSLSQYFELSCGHFTIREDQLVWDFAKPGRGKYWCETESKWVKAKPKPKVAKLPQEPLF